MGIGVNSVAAATAVVGYDLASATIWQQTSSPRVLTGISLTGSAAAGDTKVDLFVDQVKIAEFFNSKTGFPNRDDVKGLSGNYVPPGAQLHIFVTDAPATNPINVELLWE
jgi:hypothetical protein